MPEFVIAGASAAQVLIGNPNDPISTLREATLLIGNNVPDPDAFYQEFAEWLATSSAGAPNAPVTSVVRIGETRDITPTS